jgi:hypothetical protein
MKTVGSLRKTAKGSKRSCLLPGQIGVTEALLAAFQAKGDQENRWQSESDAMQDTVQN